MATFQAQSLESKHCKPCEGHTRPLSAGQASGLLNGLTGWMLEKDAKVLVKEYELQDFKAAVDLVRRIADIAEKENHHPDLHLIRYRRLRVELSTHAIGGLSENDFILAAKIESLPRGVKPQA